MGHDIGKKDLLQNLIKFIQYRVLYKSIATKRFAFLILIDTKLQYKKRLKGQPHEIALHFQNYSPVGTL